MTTWQKIETCPLNKRVLVFVPIERHRMVIALKTDMGLMLDEQMQPMPYPPFYWMPLPAPPVLCAPCEGAKDGN